MDLRNVYLNCKLIGNEGPRRWVTEMKKLRRSLSMNKFMDIKDEEWIDRVIENIP